MSLATTEIEQRRRARAVAPRVHVPDLPPYPVKKHVKTGAITPLAPARPRIKAGAPTVGLSLLVFAVVVAGFAVADRLGEWDRILGFIAGSPDFLTFSAVNGAYYPSVSGYLGLVFAGPTGAIFGVALGVCTCLGLTALWRVRRHRPSRANRCLPLAVTLLVPILTLDYMIFSAVEFTGAPWMPDVLTGHPAWLRVWVVVALGCAAVLSLTSNTLLLRWAWRREHLAWRRRGRGRRAVSL